MASLKYTVIKTKAQYYKYCDLVEAFVFSDSKSKDTNDEIELLTALIEKYDDEHNTFEDVAPIPLLRSFMADHELKAKDLVKILDVSKGYVSDILNYKKGLSKDVVRKLASHFKMSQEAFNRPYPLVAPGKKSAKTAGKLRHKPKVKAKAALYTAMINSRKTKLLSKSEKSSFVRNLSRKK